MENIVFFSLFLIVIVTYYIIYKKVKNGLDMPKTDPIILKKGNLVHYKNMHCIVLNRMQSKYDLRDLATLIIFKQIERNQIKYLKSE